MFLTKKNLLLLGLSFVSGYGVSRLYSCAAVSLFVVSEDRSSF